MLPRIAVAGHVDDGKSTLLGRLLLETDSLYPEEVAEMHRSNQRWNHPSEHLASLTDGLIEEREQGITVEVAHRWFNIGPEDKQALLLDCPGHLEFKTATLGAMTQCTVLLLVSDLSRPCSATALWLLETAIQLGVFQVVVALTKCDLVEDLEAREAARVAELQGQVAIFQKRLQQWLGPNGSESSVGLQFQSISALNNIGINGSGELLDKLRGALQATQSTGRPEYFRAVAHGPRTMVGHNRLWLGAQVLEGEIAPNQQLNIGWPGSPPRIQTAQVASVYAPPNLQLDSSRGRRAINLEITAELPDLLCPGPGTVKGAIALYSGPHLQSTRTLSALLLPLVELDQLKHRNFRIQTEGQHTIVLDVRSKVRLGSAATMVEFVLDSELFLDPTSSASPWNRGCLYDTDSFEALALVLNMQAVDQGAI